MSDFELISSLEPYKVVVLKKLGVEIKDHTTGEYAEVTEENGLVVDARLLQSLIETLQELTQRLAPLAGAMSPTAQLRVMQIAVPSTAVTGPITSAQSIAEKNIGGVSYTQRVAQENLTAVQSNINNTQVS